MRARDVTGTLEMALESSGCDQATVRHKPSLLSYNGSSYVSGELAEWLQGKGMDHVRSAPFHPQTQGKIERWHQIGFCWKTTTCQAIWSSKLGRSSNITTTNDTTRASTTSHQPMLTSGVTNPSSEKGKRSNETPLITAARNTSRKRHNQIKSKQGTRASNRLGTQKSIFI